MNAALVIARLLLAATFLLAAVTKLADRSESRQAIEDLGVPVPLAGLTAAALPVAELAAGLALIPASTARWGALAALVLLAAFIITVAVNLGQGRRPDCHCFGQVHSAPIGWTTLARNAVLSGLAVFVLAAGPGPPPFEWVSNLSSTGALALGFGLALAVLVAGQAWFSLSLFRQYGRVLVRVDALEAIIQANAGQHGGGGPVRLGLPVGAPAPVFSLPDGVGAEVSLESLVAGGRPVLLVFTDPDCGPCKALIPQVVHWRDDYSDRLTIAVLTRARGKRNRPPSPRLDTVLFQSGHEVAEAYQALGTPSAVVVRTDGRIGSRVAGGADAIRELVEETVAPRRSIPVAIAGQSSPPASLDEPAPALSLPDLGGQPVALEDYRGSEVGLLFWSTTCGFCNQMLPDLKAWEADPPQRAPALLLISTGSVEDNRRMGLTSTVLIDEDFSASRAFGASGTPSALLVSAEGKVASELAVGAEEVLALLGRQPQPAQP